jgi:hypothetical protein
MMKNYFWCDGSGQVEIKITQAQIDNVCHAGANDAAVAAESKPDINPALLKSILREYGAWDDAELSNHAANLDRVFWLACWDCFEDPETYVEPEL